MNTIPQLRVRSGYNYRNTYGRFPEIIDRLKAIGSEFAAIVDWGTWGHVRWEQTATKAGFMPGYGMEIPILSYDDEGEMKKHKPSAWILARDTRAFYNATSFAVQNGGMSAAHFQALRSCDVIRFAGGAQHLLPRESIDFIDVNAASLTSAYHSVQRARRDGIPMVLTSLNDMPNPSDMKFAAAWEVRTSVGPRHIMTLDDMWSHLQHVMSKAEFNSAINNTNDVAWSLKGLKLAKAPLIKLDGDLEELAREGMRNRLAKGHISEWTTEYEERFQMELNAIRQKEFDSYFLCVSDLVRYAKKHMLVGPARGSSAGSLICYLTDITEVDPIKYGLLFYRFIDISRKDFPDIDIDFADTKRHMVFDYLKEKYGNANVSKLGNINTLKFASTIECVRKKFGLGFEAVQGIRNSEVPYAPGDERYGHGIEDTLAQTDSGRLFQERYPAVASCMGNLELHPSHAGVHAAGILVCNEAVSNFCTVTEEGIAQLDKPDAEYINLLKIDALGLRTLGVIDDSAAVSHEVLYGLQPEEQTVFDVLNEDKVSGTFQFEGDAVRSITRQVHVDRFAIIDHITSVARPGPMQSGMSTRYIERANGREPVTYEFPELEPHLKDTFGVLIYQEQIMSIVKDIGGFDWEATSAVRKAMSKRVGAEYMKKFEDAFIEGAARLHKVPEDKARRVWAMMATFGAYGFNRSHSVAYGMVTYWTLWMKRYHKLAYCAACLRAAKDDEQTVAILKELTKEGVEYVAIDPEFSEMNWKVANGRIVGGIQNAVGFGPVKALKYVQKRASGTLTVKEKETLAKADVKFAELYEAYAKFGWAYNDPRKIGVTSGNPILNIMDVRDGDDGLVICKLVEKSIEDDNDPKRVKARIDRGQKGTRRGNTTFLDMSMVDDSTEKPVKFRIRPDLYDDYARAIIDQPKNAWYLVKGWKLKDISMFIVKNIKRIDNEPNERTESVGQHKTEVQST